MCRECAKTLGKASLGVTELEDKDSRNRAPGKPIVSCPMCGSPTDYVEVVDNIPLRTFLESIRPTLEKSATAGAAAAAAAAPEAEPPAAAAAAATTDDTVCGFCKAPATKFCRMCGPLCEQHSGMLHVKGPFTGHTLYDTPVHVFATAEEAKAATIASQASGIPSAEIAVPLCPVHKRPLRLYCDDCSQVICSHCASYGKHRGHKSLYMTRAFNSSPDEMTALIGKVEDALRQVEEIAPRFSPASSEAEKAKSLAKLHEIYGSLKEYLQVSEKNTTDEVDAIFRQFEDEVSQHIISCREIEREAQTVLESCDRVAVDSDLTKYLLYRSLLTLDQQLKRLSHTEVPELKCVVSIVPDPSARGKMRVCTLRSHLQSGDRALVYYELNKEHIHDTFAVTSDVQFGFDSAEGGSVFIPELNMIISNSAEKNNGRTLLFTTIHNKESVSKETKSDAVAFRCGGMYPAFDGHDHVYFFQANEGSSNKFGRLDVNTRKFETLADLPAGSFLPHTSAAANPQHIYMMDNKMEIWDYCVDLDTWSNTHIRLEKPARLFFDPIDLDTIVAFCADEEGIYVIDVEAHTTTKLATPPKKFSLKNNRDAFFARVSPEQFFIFTYLDDGWYLFDSKDKSWSQFENWEKPASKSASFFIDPVTRIAFYVGPSSRVLYMVELSGVAR